VTVLRIVVDVGNSRLKWARVDDGLRLGPSLALPLDDPLAWESVCDDWQGEEGQPSHWAIASVNPPVAHHLEAFLHRRQVGRVTWFRTAAEVPLAMDVEGAETGGADRALAVLAALRQMPAGRPGLVVSCGTAITIERATAAGVWQGGVIAPGLFLSARALHLMTAQLPLIQPDASAPSWGRGTLDSLAAGIFWGTVGSVRELIARQTFPDGQSPWVVWTGGDAPRLAPAVSGDTAVIVPDLVLLGLVHAAF
jgi:type III pantothenate kinase